MRDLAIRVRHRVKGRSALTRSLAGLLVRAHRFAQHRATSLSEQRWAARVIDSLTATLAVAQAPIGPDPLDGQPKGPPR